jgi:nucleoside-diphosphate-sugar epimerase
VSGAVLVTGAFGLVGSAVVGQLLAEGRKVVATDLDVAANRRKAATLASAAGFEVRWADLTDAGAVDALVAEVRPDVVVHLAAVIPPHCYARRALARRVNVGATTSLVAAAGALPAPPRLVLASSVAVYGARNPARCTSLLAADTPVSPVDLYGAHKVEAEGVVTSSGLEWVVLRLGGVLSPVPRWDAGTDMLDFEGVLPVDGRLQTVDVRDVAAAVGAATVTGATEEVFLVGGDESHRVRQGELGDRLAAAVGLAGGLGPGRPGDPRSDRDWFATDWMDTARAEEVLSFQRHSLPELLAETRAAVGPLRWPIAAAGPVVRALRRHRSPYRRLPGPYAALWTAIGRRWGDPFPDS